MRVAANIISYLFHPLLVTTYLVLFLDNYFPAILGIRQEGVLKFTLFVFMVTFIFPVLNIALMFRLSGSDATFSMNSRKQRIAPFLFISLIYCFFVGLLIYKNVPGMAFNRILTIVAALVLSGTLITFAYKISIHSLAMGGFVGIVLWLNRLAGGVVLIPVAVMIVIAGLVMSSRLVLNAHTLREVLTGVAAGLAIGMGGMIFYF